MIEFLNRLFGRQPSGATAKERLRLVLMSDHLSLAPEMIESMKRDFVDVISKYVEVDREKIDVHFEHQDKALAMLANIPITGVSRNNGTNGHTEIEPGHAELVEARPSEAEATNVVEGRPSEAEATDVVEARLSEPGHAEPVEAPSHGHGHRRKKRKRNGGQQNASGSPAPAT